MIGYGKWSLVPGIGMLLVGAAHAGDMMDEFAWSARPVIVFAGSETDPMATEQLARLEAERSALIERDMVVISLFPDRSEVEGKMSVLSSKEIRARYDVPSGVFAVLLVGKDSGVKYRASAPVDPTDLFARFDGMPMRMREMLEGN